MNMTAAILLATQPVFATAALICRAIVIASFTVEHLISSAKYF